MAVLSCVGMLFLSEIISGIDWFLQLDVEYPSLGNTCNHLGFLLAISKRSAYVLFKIQRPNLGKQ